MFPFRETLLTIVLPYCALSWLIGFGLRKIYPKSFSLKFVLSAPVFLPYLIVFNILLYLGEETLETLIYLYRNTLSFLSFFIVQFWIVVPATPPLIRSFPVAGKGEGIIYWNHLAQYIVLIIALSWFPIKMLWKKLPHKTIKNFKDNPKFTAILFLYFFLVGGSLFDLLVSQLFADWKNVAFSLISAIIGKIIEQVFRGEPTVFRRRILKEFLKLS